MPAYDAIVVGAGPNGLAAALTVARAGFSVLVVEAETRVGGGLRSEPLTLPGYVHDVCSAVYPLGIGSPFFRELPLETHGLKWIQPAAPLAHPFDDGSAAVLERSIEQTGETLVVDHLAYRKWMQPLTAHWQELLDDILAPFHFPRHPRLLTRFGLRAMRSARSVAESLFAGPHARGLFAGLAAHSMLPLENSFTAAFGILLGFLGHAVGWPIAAGGSQSFSNALMNYLLTLKSEIITGQRIDSLEQLPKSRVVLFDLTPRQLLNISGIRLPANYRRRLDKYRYGSGAFKMDWALSEPIPWKAAACVRAGTVHLGGTLEEIVGSEFAVGRGEAAASPFVLLVQPSLFDPARAPLGKHAAWAYCHVPNGCTLDMTSRIEAQIERFAPGFHDIILARSSRPPAEIEAHNANCIGGDISGGAQDFPQIFARPVFSFAPYVTPAKGIYICSASTPPGGGVHGMCGFHAARAALRRELGFLQPVRN